MVCRRPCWVEAVFSGVVVGGFCCVRGRGRGQLGRGGVCFVLFGRAMALD